jgi:subtilisin family serine protease
VSILAGAAPDYNGLLPQAEIFAASVFFVGPDGADAATTVGLVRALDWMTANNVPVVNMSLTGPDNAILHRAIENAYAQGTIVVAAVGNAGPAAKPLYPAGYDHVVAVTAVSRLKKIYRLANRGDYVDFAAPGVDVLHAAEDGRFVTSSGTSMASPFVAAVLAISIGGDGKLNEETLGEIAASAEDLGEKGFDAVYGNGLIRPLRKSGSSGAR